MIAVAADGGISPSRSEQLLCKIRPGLLALKQFEPVYVLARWIRNFFMDILNRSDPLADHQIHRAGSTIENQDSQAVHPITPESIPSALADDTTECTGIHTTNNAADYTGSDSCPVLIEEPHLEFGNGMYEEGQDLEESARGANGLWPMYVTNSFFSNTRTSDVMNFPQSDSSQYQALYFLADLGFANSE